MMNILMVNILMMNIILTNILMTNILMMNILTMNDEHFPKYYTHFWSTCPTVLLLDF